MDLMDVDGNAVSKPDSNGGFLLNAQGSLMEPLDANKTVSFSLKVRISSPGALKVAQLIRDIVLNAFWLPRFPYYTWLHEHINLKTQRHLVNHL